MLSVGLLAYLPGLSGDFHFDDHVNLSVIADYGRIDSIEKFRAFVTSGIAGPTGRPVSLVSFLVNATDWPAEPRPFLWTNLLFHLLNGLILAWVLHLLISGSRDAELRKAAPGIAVIAAACWLLHPYMVSTTLYVVQRMTQLSALFSLVGIALYLHGRRLAYRGIEMELAGLAWSTFGLAVGTLLAVFSKENGVLLPVLLMVVEFAAIRPLWGPPPSNSFFRIWSVVALLLPTLLVTGYLLVHGIENGLSVVDSGRDFTLGQRLLTQPRILFEYLSNLLVPRPAYLGLFRDDYPVSRSLLDPPSTAFYLAALVALAGLAFALRNRAPLMTTAILFYLTGHLVESSTIMLELFFDHRNYLPAMLLFVPLAAWLWLRPGLHWLALLGLVGLALLTFQHARLWGKPADLYAYWSARNPGSTRAHVAAAGRMVRDGRLVDAETLLDGAVSHQPDSPALRLMLLSIRYARGTVREDDLEQALRAVREGKFDRQVPRMMEPLVDKILAGSQRTLPAEALNQLFGAFLGSQRYRSSPSMSVFLNYEHGRLLLSQGEGTSACSAFQQALADGYNVETAISIAALLAGKGYFRDALALLKVSSHHLDRTEGVGLRYPRAWYKSEISRLERQMMDDSEAAGLVQRQTCDWGDGY